MSFWKRCHVCKEEMGPTWQAIVVGDKRFHPDCWKTLSVEKRAKIHGETVKREDICGYSPLRKK